MPPLPSTASNEGAPDAAALNDVESQVTNPIDDDVGPLTAAEMAAAKHIMDGDLDDEYVGEYTETYVSVFTVLKIITAISALYMSASVWIFFYDADDTEICPYTVVCATNYVELTLLTLSRLSAGALYASLAITIFSKCYATRSFLHHSWLGAVIDFEPTHDLHIYFGYLTLLAGFKHGILHCARFIYASEASLIYETDTGRSGMVACAFLLPIVLPMKFECVRTKMSFQIRKNLHMLFIFMLVALCFHSVKFRYVGSTFLVWYILDRFYFTTKQTFLITDPVFESVGRGTMVALDLPEGYHFKAGSYIYVNSPTISRSEWHPFSIIQVPGSVPRAAFYAEAVGDWTHELFRLGLARPRLPLWITAAQPSLMEKSIYYDNILLVCTGAGITPAVSIIERFAKRKNIHLMWMSRNTCMVALFEKQLQLVNSTVHLTGKHPTETNDALKRLLQPPLRQDVENSRVKKTLRSIITEKTFMSRLRALAREEEKFDAEERHHLVPKNDRRIMSVDLGSRHSGRFGGISRAATEKHVTGISEVSATNATPPPANDADVSTTEPGTPVDAVTLNFGRPDIGKYLTETFAKQKQIDDERTASPAQGVGNGAGGVGSVTTPKAGTLGRSTQRALRSPSTRLDNSQRTSKEMLMAANTGVVQAARRNAAKEKASTGKADFLKRASVGAVPGALPWIVLYCGANPKVEDAIAKTCDPLGVKWQKEYFGAW